MSSFDWKKNIEDSIKDGLIITIGAARIFYRLKAANVKPPKASLDAMDILKFAGGFCGGYWLNIMQFIKNGSTSKYNNKNFMALLRPIKLTQPVVVV